MDRANFTAVLAEEIATATKPSLTTIQINQ